MLLSLMLPTDVMVYHSSGAQSFSPMDSMSTIKASAWAKSFLEEGVGLHMPELGPALPWPGPTHPKWAVSCLGPACSI